jgi:hypothetical protein
MQVMGLLEAFERQLIGVKRAFGNPLIGLQNVFQSLIPLKASINVRQAFNCLLKCIRKAVQRGGFPRSGPLPSSNLGLGDK